MLVLPTWVDASRLVEANTEEDVIQRGFQFPSQQGSMFTVGSFKEALKTEGKPKAAKKGMLCNIIIGRSHVVKDEATAEKDDIPNGYESFYIPSRETLFYYQVIAKK